MVDTALVELYLQIVGTVVGSWLVTQLIIRLITRGLKRAHAQPGIIRSVRDGFILLWLVFAVTGALTVSGVASAFSFLTFSGIIGLTVSLALQNTLSNMINGIMIIYEGVIRVNDSVEISGVKGAVMRIGLRSTWIRTESGSIAVLSNSNLAAGPLVNHTAIARLEAKLRV